MSSKPRARANADARADKDNQPNPGQGRNNEPEDRNNTPNAPGNSKNPPGQDKKTPDKNGKDKESPGNSANAPGHNKDGPGNSPNTPGLSQKLEFDYDQAGNLVSILSDLFNTHYTYDSEDHLISATINGNHEAIYTYNALGLRNSKTTQRGTVYYVYDGTTLIAELDEEGEILAYYSHDLDGKLVSVTYGDETYFYHFIHRGDTLYMTDQDGNIAASYTYDAWGNIMSKEGDLANKNPYRYKGRHGYYYDSDTDLYLLNSRWYNPELKRFMTRDNHRGEAADPVSLNRYVYCGNDPVNYVDPMGTYRVTVSINGGGGGGTPKPTVPEPPKPPKKIKITPPDPVIKSPPSYWNRNTTQTPQPKTPSQTHIPSHWPIPSDYYQTYQQQISNSPSIELPTLYRSPDEAAVDFVKNAVPLTLNDGKERGAFIYELKMAGLGEWYFYPYTYKGMHNNVILGFVAGYERLPRVRIFGFSLVPMSFAHTHPKCECHIGDEFSPADEFLTYLPGIKYVYLGTPDEETLRIDRKNLTPVEIKIYRHNFFNWANRN